MKHLLHAIWIAISRFFTVDPVFGAHGRGAV